MHSRAHAVLQCSQTEMWEKRGQLIWHLNPPSLPPSILSLAVSLSLLSPFAVTLSPVLFHFTFLLPLFSSHPSPLHQMNALSFLFLAVSINASDCLIPAGVRERKKKRERQTRLEARHLWVYLYGTEGVSALRAGPTPILADTSYWHVPEWDQQPTRVQEDEKERYGKAASFYQLCTIDVVKRDLTPDSLHATWSMNRHWFKQAQSPSKRGTQLHFLTEKNHPWGTIKCYFSSFWKVWHLEEMLSYWG